MPNVPNDQSIEDLVARLERERLEADRLYNDALTAVDRALQSVPHLPDAPASYDSSRLTDVNSLWDILPGGVPPPDTSFKGRIAGLVWRLVGPALETQKRFNAALVDHLNRNVAAHHQTSQTLAELIDAVGRELSALVRFESLLIQSLQMITIYVDSKDRSLGGSDLRQRLLLTEQRLLALKRDVAHAAATRSPSGEQASPIPASVDGSTAVEGGAAPFAGSVDSITYLGFEDRFRGARETIGRRVEDYVPLLAAASDIVDIGCGRGELLSLLQARGVSARGVDTNAAMVDVCRSRGLNAEQGDALAFLRSQGDDRIGGLIAVQVVEHFEPAYLVKFLEAAYHAMRSGAPLVLETINPACWMAFFETYIRDLTHKQPLHPDTLKYLVQASGFSDVDVQFREPVPEGDRLDRVRMPVADSSRQEWLGPVSDLAAALNAHADKLNRRLFSSMDYVVVARR